MLGGTLELIALGWMNVGAAQSPDSALASIISAILVIVGHQSIATGIAIALPVAAAGQVLTVFARTITVVFQHAATKRPRRRAFAPSTCCMSPHWGCRHCAWQSRRWWSRCSLARIWSAVCSARSGIRHRGLQIAGGFIVVVGYAMVLRMMGVKYLMPFFSSVFSPGLSRLQPAGLRRRGRHHRADLHPAQSTVA